MANLRDARTFSYADVRNILDTCAVFLDWSGVKLNSPTQKEASARLAEGADRLRDEALKALK
eukprot:7921009-Lingulodinium_polyedra.AAC.1